MPVLDEYAARLSQAYLERARQNRILWQSEMDAEGRQRTLTPADGWPGKNEEARKAARDAKFAEDGTLANIQINWNAAKAKLIELAGEIEALESERRAVEWRIRERLVEALDTRGTAHNHHGDRAEDAFDDVPDQVQDEGATQAVQSADRGAPEPSSEQPVEVVEFPF